MSGVCCKLSSVVELQTFHKAFVTSVLYFVASVVQLFFSNSVVYECQFCLFTQGVRN